MTKTAMPRVSMFLTLLACLSIAGCGGYYFVGFVSNPGGTSSISGIIVSLKTGFASDPSGVTPITVVTFNNGGNDQTMTFCGDQENQFTVNRTVKVDFTTGILCAVIVQVVIVT